VPLLGGDDVAGDHHAAGGTGGLLGDVPRELKPRPTLSQTDRAKNLRELRETEGLLSTFEGMPEWIPNSISTLIRSLI
jgi:hypothetical protein